MTREEKIAKGKKRIQEIKEIIEANPIPRDSVNALIEKEYCVSLSQAKRVYCQIKGDYES